MFAYESDNFMNRVSQALNRPIHSRCAELTVLFDRGSAKDLQNFFPLLVDNIFGPQGTLSWGLRSITAALKPQDFQTLQHFLSPCGPMFNLIYGLLKDPFIKYEFSITYLPTKIRQLLESTAMHPFYSELVHISPQNKQVVSLMLNAFDYYMFHFAYHLINPWHQRSGATLASSWNTVYYILCCDYVLHFLPTDPNNPVTPIINYTGKNPVQLMQPFTRPTRVSKLLLSSIYAEPINEFNSLHPPLERHPRSEIWRSETVLTVFLDMWLSNDQVSQYNESFNLSSSKTLYFNELPTGEYVRIIRVLVKQLHAFASSGKIDDSHMGELKKITVPMMQGKMYVFLRNLIHRWPLDGSFRLVLELWLSFIQPWRYPGNTHMKQLNQPEVNPDLEDMNFATLKSVDKEFLPFIAENILAYVVVFQQLLPRFTRVDLSSPKNSLMLYRLTKVFDQPNLVPLIRGVESCIEERNLSPRHSFNVSALSTMPPLSPTSRWSTNTMHYTLHKSVDTMNDSKDMSGSSFFEANKHNCGKYAAIIKQKIYELEGPNFCYKPLFTTPAAPEVYEIIKQIKKSEVTAQNIIQARMEEIKRIYSGFFGFFRSVFMKLDTSSDEFTLEERKKVPVYLDFSYQHLTDMFQINECMCMEPEIISEVSSPQRQEINNENFQLLLTPEKVKERIRTITYEGDPDLHPIRSTENKFFVRMLYHWATKINEKYSPLINKLYYDDSYTGKLSRQFIYPPRTIYKYDKSQPGRSTRIPEYLPPRISLRYFASHKFLAYIIIGLLISRFYNYSAFTFLLCVCIIWFLYCCVKAFFDKGINQHSTTHIGHLSFNDSL